jgi:hypothetical protein
VKVNGSVCDVSKGAAMEKVNDPVAPANAPVPPVMVAVPVSVPGAGVAAAAAAIVEPSGNKNAKAREVVLPVGTPFIESLADPSGVSVPVPLRKNPSGVPIPVPVKESVSAVL